MASLSRAESKRLYSWWWEGHTSPKNSKWLRENLADIDSKIKSMIKLIEEDADSFALKAEMYYEKRPELMKLVEEFYRSYRALAERYDHATGALRQAHRAMAEAFPNQVPFLQADDSPTGSSSTKAEQDTIEMPHSLPALLELDALHKDALGLSRSLIHAAKRIGSYDEPDSTNKKGLKQVNELFELEERSAHHVKFSDTRVTKGLYFHGENKNSSEYRMHAHIMSKSEQADKVETEVHTIKETLAKLEDKKEAGLLQYQQAVERLSNLETEVSHAQNVAKGFNERASKADTEVQMLNQTLSTLQAEKEAGLQQYQQCLDRISCLEMKIACLQEDAGERANKAETEVKNLKQALARLEAEKELTGRQYNQFLETISNLETKLSHAEEESRSLTERSVRAETEVQLLKEAIAKLEEDKEAAALQYQHSLETISYLERKISQVQDEAKRLSSVIVMGVAKLNSTEEQYLQLERETQSLQSEVETLSEKAELQEQKLTEKDLELRRLQTGIQQEFVHSMQVEEVLQTLQDMHLRSQEEQRFLTLELQNGIKMMNEMQLRYHILEEDVQRFQEENKSLIDQNISSSLSIKKMQEEILSLEESKANLEDEVDAHAEQRNALQNELYCLKEEINDLSTNYLDILEQVKLVGLRPDCLKSSVKDLQDENSRMKEVVQREEDEKVALLEKLQSLENLLERNVLLENSLSDVTSTLEVLRDMVKALEETCQTLQGENSALVVEKDALIQQLKTAIENVELLSDKNTLLKDTLSNANADIEVLREKSKSLEEFCQSLDNEKCGILTERDNLVSQWKNDQEKLENLEKRYTELEGKYCGLEEENKSKVHQVEELQASLYLEKQEHESFIQSSETQLSQFDQDIQILQEVDRRRNKEFEKQQDESVRAELEIFILRRCIQDMEERNLSMLVEFQKHFEASTLLEKLVAELKRENFEQQVKVKNLLNQAERLRLGIHQMLFALKVAPNYECQDKVEEDEILLKKVLSKIEVLEKSLLENQDQRQQLLIEKSVFLTLLGQMRVDVVKLTCERNNLNRDIQEKTEELLIQESEKKDLLELNEQLRLEVGSIDQQQKVLKAEMNNQCAELSSLKEMYPVLQNENVRLLEENLSLTKEVSDLKKENCKLEEESLELKELAKDLDHLQVVNDALKKEVREMRERLEMAETENLYHKESVGKLGDEMNLLRNANEQLNHHIEIGKDALNQKAVELSAEKERIKATEGENMKLRRELKELAKDYEEARMKREVLEKQIVNLSEDNAQKKDEIGLHKANEKLESERATLHEEIKNQRVKEDDLCSTLKEKLNEVKLWEAEATTLYADCQVTGIHAALFKEKMHELVGTCERLSDESTSKVINIEQLKGKLHVLECENEGLKSELLAYSPVVVALRESVVSLEDHLFPQIKNHTDDSQEKEVSLVERHLHDNNYQQLTGNQRPLMISGAPALLELLTRLKAIEKSVKEKRQLVMQESLDTDILTKAALTAIQELQSTNSSALEKDIKASGNVAMHLEQEKHGDDSSKPASSEVCSEVVMKDIPLDQVSQCSSYDHGTGMLALSRTGIDETNEEMIEFWEPPEHDQNPDFNYKMPHASTYCHQTEAVEQKGEYPSAELRCEKELAVDKRVVSKRIVGLHQEGNERKILERLDSDVHKLRDLQATVQGLYKKLEQFRKSKKMKKSKKAMDIECTTLKELKEVEEAIVQLVGINGDLTKSVTQFPIVFDDRSILFSEEMGKIRRRSRVSEQAQQGSEKIGRLQLEVQRIQFALLGLEAEPKSQGTKFGKKKILLRDYLYGRERSYPTPGRKKSPFFACVNPPTNLD